MLRVVCPPSVSVKLPAGPDCASAIVTVTGARFCPCSAPSKVMTYVPLTLLATCTEPACPSAAFSA